MAACCNDVRLGLDWRTLAGISGQGEYLVMSAIKCFVGYLLRMADISGRLFRSLDKKSVEGTN
jgi:hypothetical protein